MAFYQSINIFKKNYIFWGTKGWLKWQVLIKSDSISNEEQWRGVHFSPLLCGETRDFSCGLYLDSSALQMLCELYYCELSQDSSINIQNNNKF